MYILSFDREKKYTDYEWLACFIAGERRAELSARASDMSALCSLFAELIVRRHISLETGIHPSSVEIVRSRNGKPRAVGYDEFHFSVSHKGTAVCVEFSPSPIGIDIEAAVRPNLRVAERYFTKNELAAMSKAEDKAEIFFTVWTRKEAYSKMTGQGLSCGFERVETLGGELDAIAETICLGEYVISSVGDSRPPIEVTEISPKELEEWFSVLEE